MSLYLPVTKRHNKQPVSGVRHTGPHQQQKPNEKTADRQKGSGRKTTLKMNKDNSYNTQLVCGLQDHYNQIKSQQKKNKTCYICKKKGHIAKNCKEPTCPTCGKKHKKNECLKRMEFVMKCVLSKLNDSYNKNISYINNKIAVLKSELNRRQREIEKIKRVETIEQRERAKVYNSSNKIIKQIQYEKIAKSDLVSKIAQELKHSIQVTRVYTIEKETKDAKVDEPYIANEMEVLIKNKLQEEGKMLTKYGFKMRGRISNKKVIDFKAYDKSSFWDTKHMINLTTRVVFNYTYIPEQQTITDRINKVMKGKVIINKSGNNKDFKSRNNYIINIKRKLQKINKTKTIMEKLGDEIDIDELNKKKLGAITLLDKHIDELNKALIKRKNGLKKIRVDERQIRFEMTKQDSRIAQRINRLRDLESKIRDKEQYLKAYVKKGINEILGEERKKARTDLDKINIKLREQARALKDISAKIRAKEKMWDEYDDAEFKKLVEKEVDTRRELENHPCYYQNDEWKFYSSTAPSDYSEQVDDNSAYDDEE